MSDGIKHTWGYVSWTRANYLRNGFLGDDKYNAYAATFVDENYTEPGEAWQQVEITYFARHPVKALKAICATPRTVGELTALDGAILD